jgi:hypothetical protein
MKRLYYVANNVEEADAMHAALKRSNISDWNYHVVSKDDVGVYKHHFHGATPLQANDVIRQGERGALIGLVAGIIVALIITGVFNYFGNYLLATFIVVTVLVTLHGAWAGGMVGLSQPNSKLERFRADIDAGRYLFIVDVGKSNYGSVKERMARFNSALRGEDNRVLITPFG